MTKRVLLPSCCAALLMLGVIVSGTARADDVEKMQGAWKITHGEIGDDVGGKKDLSKMEIVIEGTKLTFVEGDKTEVVHFTLSPDGKARDVNFYKNADKKEKIWHGIFDISSGELKLCWGAANHARPKDFAVKKGTEQRYFVMKKK